MITVSAPSRLIGILNNLDSGKFKEVAVETEAKARLALKKDEANIA
ncbi:MAG: hypothetical protein AAF609_11740 [Cyanobacteria bacterium P01_C01_bin.120]